ncbi:multidrug efflux pump channel protein [Bacteroides fragilis CAG:558]|nr:multidrug efflux pump channel protein [Bacteroides fragilis CAG:558]
MKKLIISLAATLALSSCGIYSKYKPATEVPDGLYGQEGANPSDSASNLGSLPWQEVFTDPCLRTLIDTALVRNTDLRTAHLRVKEAEATLLSARLSYLPAFSLSPQGTASSFDGGKASQTYSLPVSASWEIDIFGRLTNAKRRAQAVVAQSRDYEQAVQTQLIAAVANNYYTLLMLDAQIEISTATEAAWKESVATTRAMKAAGMVTEAALSQTEATYYNICTTLLDLREQLNQVENALSLLLADVPRTLPRGRLAEQRLPENLSVGVPLQMLANRPDVRSAEQSLAQAFYTTNAARSAFYPSITLSGSAGWTNSAGAMIVTPGKFLAPAVAQVPCHRRGLADAAFVQPGSEHRPAPHSQSATGGGTPQLRTDVAQRRKRGQQCPGAISDGTGQGKLLREAGGFPRKRRPQHTTADEAWQHDLSGSAHRTADVAQCATLASGQPVY